ncbi:SRPBCC domain-containing protein [Geomonas anaerohicana]|uniref:SRPBCC domain-containing protein n=1 Tax=Geomonas anaerohicana TaxID=2798583 RepID=A0ABS0YKI1_9BACT|nr:SRPBCC domain-containing protein [Geomonas anaerohicana]MBJ6752847.1 SRPBCC domain-containing protein [Geomonas anaerohicana]
MKPFRTETVLQTTRERVWELLSDFSLYPQWNPLFPKLEGPGTVGGDHELVVHLPGIDPFTVQATLEEKGEGVLWWRSTFLGRPLLAWTFSCRTEVVGDQRLKVLLESEFSGLLAPLFRFALARSMEEGMEQLNQALRRWGEKGNVRCMRC